MATSLIYDHENPPLCQAYLFGSRRLSGASEKVFISLENLNQAGVYALICKVSNKFDIGSSVYLGARLLDYMQPAYLAQLVNGPILRAFRKYGVNN